MVAFALAGKPPVNNICLDICPQSVKEMHSVSIISFLVQFLLLENSCIQSDLKCLELDTTEVVYGCTQVCKDMVFHRPYRVVDIIF